MPRCCNPKSHQLRDRKIAALDEPFAPAKPAAILSANMGCIVHLQNGTDVACDALGGAAGSGHHHPLTPRLPLQFADAGMIVGFFSQAHGLCHD